MSFNPGFNFDDSGGGSGSDQQDDDDGGIVDTVTDTASDVADSAGGVVNDLTTQPSDRGGGGGGGAMVDPRDRLTEPIDRQEPQPEPSPEPTETVTVGDTEVGAEGPALDSDSTPAGVEITGDPRVREQAAEFEQEIVETSDIESGAQVSIRTEQRDGETRLVPELTSVGQERVAEVQTREAETQRTRALEGLGFEGVNTQNVQGPDAPGSETLAEQEAEAQQTRALEGIGFEGVGTPTVQAPDAPGSQTLAEEQAQADLETALTGLGFEGVGTENIQAPDAPGSQTLAEQETERRFNRALEGIGFGGVGTERTLEPVAAGQETLEEQRVEEQIAQGETPARFEDSVGEVRGEAADVFSQQLGFDVPRSAVDVDARSTRSGLVFAPELDTDAAREAGRRQQDIFSEAVTVGEFVAGRNFGALGDPMTAGQASLDPVDLPGEGSVRNVRAVEEFGGEGRITGTLPQGFGEDLEAASRTFSEDIAQPAGEGVGDLFAIAQVGGRGAVGGSPLAAGATPMDPFGAQATIDRSETTAEGIERVGDLTRPQEDEPTRTTNIETFGQGAGTTAVEIANLPGFASAGFTAADIAATGATRTIEGEPGSFAEDVGGQAVLTGADVTETAVESPVATTGAIAGGVASGVGVGAAGQRIFTGLRGRLATRGMDFQGDVDIENIERPDVRSGESQLTRFSEEAVSPTQVTGATRPIDVEDFPATPATTTSQELRNLAREFDDPQIRRALDVEADESVLFTARSGVKGERFTPRSGRGFDPDAAFFSGSVARNFLDIPDTADAGILSGGLRRPRPLEAGRSLVSAARQQDTPVIVGTAGEVRMLPEDIVSARTQRPAMTNFLRERADSGEFFTLRPEAGSAEAEALTAAEGAVDTPLLGSGVLSADEATEFVEVARPFRTEIRGERVPIQLFRQDTGDVTPLSEQRRITDRLGFGFGDRGQVDLAQIGRAPERLGQRTRTTVSESLGSGSRSFTPGGRPGTPVAPNLFGLGTPTRDVVETDTEQRETIGDFRSGMGRVSRDRDSSIAPRDRDSELGPSSADSSVFGSGFSFGLGSLFGGASQAVSQPSSATESTTSQPSSNVSTTPTGSSTSPVGSDSQIATTPSSVFGFPSTFGVSTTPSQPFESTISTTSFTPTDPSTPTPSTPTSSPRAGANPFQGNVPTTPIIPTPPRTSPSPGPGQPDLDRDTDDDEDEFSFIGAQTPEFVNPVASGSQFLFGGALSGSVGGSATENVASLLPVGQDAQDQPTGEVEPLSERGRDAFDADPFGFDEF